MKKSVTYSVVPRKNPVNEESVPLFYARAQSRGEEDIRSLSKHIEQMCTVTRTDVVAVLTALESTITDCLANGEIVRLGELGSLQVSLSSNGAPTEKEFSISMIKSKRILFRPGLTLQNMLKTLAFQRVDKKAKPGENGAGPDADSQSSDPGSQEQQSGGQEQQSGKQESQAGDGTHAQDVQAEDTGDVMP